MHAGLFLLCEEWAVERGQRGQWEGNEPDCGWAYPQGLHGRLCAGREG